MNPNVKLALSFSFLMSASRGIWAFTTLSVFLLDLTGSSASVGVAEGMQGIFLAVFAVIAGIWADKMGRSDVVLWISGGIGIGSLMLTLFGLFEEGLSDHDRFWILTASLCLIGGFQGLSTTCIETLFADSIKTGKRSKYNTYRFMLTQVSSISGPLICVFLFSYYGNEWTRHRLTSVFAIGIALTFVPILLLFLFSEDYALGDESESHHIPSTPGGNMDYQMLVDDDDDDDDDDVIVRERSRSQGDEMIVENFQQWERRNGSKPSLLGQQHIVPVMIASDVISALGSGMTVKFFPLFFKEVLHLSPISVNSIYIGLPLFMTIVSLLARYAAKRFGRVQACLCLSLLGCIGLGGLGLVTDNGQFTMVFYAMSTLQHCSRPIRKGILMDFVEKSRRARINSIDAITRLNWSGSAFLGGLSIDKFGFGKLFLVTAIIQLISSLLLLVLLPLVPFHESRRRENLFEDPLAGLEGDGV